jgi:hypothetical protein
VNECFGKGVVKHMLRGSLAGWSSGFCGGLFRLGPDDLFDLLQGSRDVGFLGFEIGDLLLETGDGGIDLLDLFSVTFRGFFESVHFGKSKSRIRSKRKTYETWVVSRAVRWTRDTS